MAQHDSTVAPILVELVNPVNYLTDCQFGRQLRQAWVVDLRVEGVGGFVDSMIATVNETDDIEYLRILGLRYPKVPVELTLRK